ERIKSRNWHIQINTSPGMIEAIENVLATSPVPIVFDHFGGALQRAGEGTKQPGFGAAVRLVKSGKAYLKISASGGVSPDNRAPLPDVTALARAFVSANPERVLWGTNWPHPDAAPKPGRKNTDLAPLLQTDDGTVLNLLPVWVPDAATRRTLLVENPARLY